VVEVRLGHRGQRGRLAGDVQPLPRGHRAAHLDDRLDLVLARPHRDRAEPHRAVGEVEHLVGVHRLGEAGPRDRHPLRVALAVAPAHEDDVVARLELRDAVPQAPDAQLGSRKVLQDGHLAPGPPRGLPDPLRRLRVLLRRSVREVQPGDVHPRLDHAGEHLGVARRRPDGGDDLGAAHERKVPQRRRGARSP
jgi:hypothetical protein